MSPAWVTHEADPWVIHRGDGVASRDHLQVATGGPRGASPQRRQSSVLLEQISKGFVHEILDGLRSIFGEPV